MYGNSSQRRREWRKPRPDRARGPAGFPRPPPAAGPPRRQGPGSSGGAGIEGRVRRGLEFPARTEVAAAGERADPKGGKQGPGRGDPRIRGRIAAEGDTFLPGFPSGPLAFTHPACGARPHIPGAGSDLGSWPP